MGNNDLMYLLQRTDTNAADEGNTNITDALFGIAAGLEHIARAIEHLGTANANTRMGAIELLAMEVKDGFEKLAFSMPGDPPQ